MKKLFTQITLTALALTIAISTFAQSPTATRQRRTSSTEDTQSTAAPQASPAPEVTDDAQTNRADPTSEEAAIVPYYNNFFTTYRLGPEDVVSVNVFAQDRYSKQGIIVPPSGRIYLALIPEGIFVNGKTCDQVA